MERERNAAQPATSTRRSDPPPTRVAEDVWSAAFDAELGKSTTHNLLVVSDLHIGESLSPSDPGFKKQIATVNHALSRFLEYYAAQRIEERPWRLVIAGDMIDFLQASLTMRKESFDGPRRAELAAVHALDRVVGMNKRVFRDLAAFVGAGNELVVIKGNHDAEFHWDEVQSRFLTLLTELFVELGAPGAGGSGPTPEVVEGFRRRVTFCRWFYYEKGLVYIEHGNQYDAFCSFEHVLSPVLADESELEDPISHQTFRAFADLIGTLDVQVVERWKMIDYARWLTGLGPRIIARMAYTYFASLKWMVQTRRRLAAAAQKAREEHHRRLRDLTQRFRLPEDVINKLDALRERPAGISLLLGMRMLYMEHVFLVALNVLVLLGLVAVPGDGIVRASIGGAFGGLSSVLALLASRSRQIDSHPKLLDRARRVAQLIRVPFVVFGHSHVPIVQSIERAEDDPTTYINTGSWTHEGRRGLTHLCILVGKGRPKAELRRWDPGTQRPAPVEV